MPIPDHELPEPHTCDYWHYMDAKFDTSPQSPLHHDNRCKTCCKAHNEPVVNQFGQCQVCVDIADVEEKRTR